MIADTATVAAHRHPAEVVISQKTTDLWPHAYGLTGHCQGQAGGHSRCPYHEGGFFGDGLYSPGFALTANGVVLGELIGTYDQRLLYRCPCACHEHAADHVEAPPQDSTVRHQRARSWAQFTDSNHFSAVGVCSCAHRVLHEFEPGVGTHGTPATALDYIAWVLAEHATNSSRALRRGGHHQWDGVDEVHEGEWRTTAWCTCGQRFDVQGAGARRTAAVERLLAEHIAAQAQADLDARSTQLTLDLAGAAS